MFKTFEMELAGRTLTVETGKYAGQANGNCLVRCGDTAVMVMATASSKPRDGMDFFPLTVDFDAKMYSVGKIPGGFNKREARPPEKSILTSRLMDRPIRPLFDKGTRNDVQIVATVLSVDKEIPPDVYAMIGSSIALTISDIPFEGPTGAVQIGLVDGEFVVNPASADMANSELDLIVSGTSEAVLMVEASANLISEAQMLEAILLAHEEIKKIVAFQVEMQKEVGKEKIEFNVSKPLPEVEEAVREFGYERIQWSLDSFDRYERRDRENQVADEIKTHFAEVYPENMGDISDAIYNITKEIVRKKIVQGVRPDGRKLDEVRPIWSEVGILARAHGTGVFTRGETQVMSIATLGSISESQRIDDLTYQETKRYMHHYNFPAYSVGETRPNRGPGRREIGHGALAERALLPVIPSEEDFPYAIRVVSEVLSSNGSTSQASVCGSTLSLMDAGVPIKAPVAGVAMGLIKDKETGDVAVLTDIQGLEDFLGDMDFKVAGTKDGISAIQMDIKIKGINKPVLESALEQARIGRLHILGKMNEVLDAPRGHLSTFAPKIESFSINPDKIREVIGPGGKMINSIIDETGVKIDITDDGTVSVSTSDAEAMAKAISMINNIVKEIEVGEIYFGTVVRIMNFGAFVELLPGKDGLVHISKLANYRVEKVEDEVKVGDRVLVKVIAIDDKKRVNLSRKELLEEEAKMRAELES